MTITCQLNLSGCFKIGKISEIICISFIFYHLKTIVQHCNLHNSNYISITSTHWMKNGNTESQLVHPFQMQDSELVPGVWFLSEGHIIPSIGIIPEFINF